MYSKFFGFEHRPFSAAPSADRYFPASVTESARVVLARCLERAEGVGVLIGPAGTGKTLLLNVLAEQFRPQFSVALLTNGRIVTRRALLQSILFEQGLPCGARDEGDLRLALIDQLSVDNHSGLILLIDEAHTLPLRLLEEVRLLSNIVRNGEYKVRVVLAGGPSLEERLASPKLDTLQQRITARCYLQAWNRHETREFVRAQVHVAGGIPEQIFAGDALDAIHNASDGIPRLINQVCDSALLQANETGKCPIKKSAIESAWAELQQLPTPQNTIFGASSTETAGTSSSIVEFGTLDEFPTSSEKGHVKQSQRKLLEEELYGENDLELDEIDLQLLDDELADANDDGPRILASSLPETDAADVGEDFEPEVTLDLDEQPSIPFQSRSSRADDSAELRPSSHEFGEIGNDLPRGSNTKSLLDNLGSIERQIHQLTSEFEPEIVSPTTTLNSKKQTKHTIADHDEGIELSWTSENPFGEDFLEEEVVLDPYLHDARQLFRNKPLVSTKVSQQLGNQLSQAVLEVPPPRPAIRIAPVAEETIQIVEETSAPQVELPVQRSSVKTERMKQNSISQNVTGPSVVDVAPFVISHLEPAPQSTAKIEPIPQPEPIRKPTTQQKFAAPSPQFDLTSNQVITVSHVTGAGAPSAPVTIEQAIEQNLASLTSTFNFDSMPPRSSDELIIVEDVEVSTAAPRVVRKEYKQLFSQLKQGQG